MTRITIAAAAAVLGGFLLTTNALTAPAAASETTWNGVKVAFPDAYNDVDACIVRGGDNDAAMATCLARETPAWDQRLTAAFNELRRQLPAKDFAALQAFQRAWIADRDAACRTIGGEGTAGPVLFESCYTRLTALRAVELEKRANIKK
jgi:uncharacterized protein YecT (DUF1311 family)